MNKKIQIGIASGLVLLMVIGVSVSMAADKLDLYGTNKRGVLTAAMCGDMPMTKIENGKLIGTDGGILVEIAGRLGLEVEPLQMEWAGEIPAVQTKRADIMLGAMGWTAERAKILNLTEPIYFFGGMLCQKKTTNYASVEDLKGRTIGTVQGFLWIPEMKKFPGVKEVKLYDTSDAAIRDVVAGRVDAVMLDSPLVQYLIKQHPEWNLHQIPIKPHPDFPMTRTKYAITMGVHQDNDFLLSAINREIIKMRESGRIKEIMAEYGLGDPYWFTPPPEWQ